jgi:hypothetical protein
LKDLSAFAKPTARQVPVLQAREGARPRAPRTGLHRRLTQTLDLECAGLREQLIAGTRSLPFLPSHLDNQFAGGGPGFEIAMGLSDLGQWVAPVDSDTELSVAYQP